ncbi:class I adenylate-forming enzyme family protein [Actinomycetospora chiangmaiensis]|uniref:class I adenylate-forming enzyme family protein n=1 Tax=Actinomycetospora chiangmaiensis TaxID=402650 RepID=UPI0003633DCB|nr:AMP-binding protein [Actinomycetospora chiangmaiensis]
MNGIAELLSHGAHHRPVFLAARGTARITHGDLRGAADRWGDALDRAGIARGARIAIAVADPLTFATVHLAVLAAGRVSVPLDPGAPAAERRRTTGRTRPVLLVTDGGPATGDLPTVVVDHAGRPGPLPVVGPHRGSDDGGATLLATSGSTGEPKGVLLTADRLRHVARAVADHLELTPADRGLTPLPLFHVNAQVVGLLATLTAGASLVLDARFHRTDFWERARAHDVTWINAVPAVLTVLGRDPVDPVPPPGLRLLRSASAPLPAAVRTAVEERTGVRVVESYGMTEAASQITAAPLHEPCPPGSAGRAAGAEVAVHDAAGHPVGPGVRGRVWIRGAGVITAYEDGRAAERFAAGWLDTGDVGHLDDAGFLFLAGRDDDVINRGGELLHPREIEEVLLGDPRVAEAVVVGRPHDVLGAVPVACVRATRGGAELADALHARCRAELSRWKCPVDIQVLADLPRGATGKVRRADLRELVAAGA